MVRRGVFSAIIAIACSSQVVHARDYYYFNKPDVSRDQYVADKTECDRLADGVTAPKYQGPSTVYVPGNPNLTTGQNAVAAGLAGLFAGLLLGGVDKKAIRSVERTCMADKGYGRYKVEKALVEDIEKIKAPDERINRYFALASASAPTGERIKE